MGAKDYCKQKIKKYFTGRQYEIDTELNASTYYTVGAGEVGVALAVNMVPIVGSLISLVLFSDIITRGANGVIHKEIKPTGLVGTVRDLFS